MTMKKEASVATIVVVVVVYTAVIHHVYHYGIAITFCVFKIDFAESSYHCFLFF